MHAQSKTPQKVIKTKVECCIRINGKLCQDLRERTNAAEHGPRHMFRENCVIKQIDLISMFHDNDGNNNNDHKRNVAFIWPLQDAIGT